MSFEALLDKKKQKLAALEASCDELNSKFESLSQKLAINASSFYRNKTPEKVNQQHIDDLKLYNELRDTGLRLIQMVADEKQCKMKDVFEEIGYDMKD